MTLAPRFGLFLSQANRSWDEVLASFQLAEVGFDHAWLVDHLLDTDGPPDHPCHEAWTLLAAIAARTERIRLGVLVTSNTFRNPAILAKEAVTVDHISRGRLILGLGSGWHEDEHRQFGIDLPPAAERIDRLEEAIQVIQALMTTERVDFNGRHYRLDGARLEPKPVQDRIPLLIAAHRPRMIRLAARYADQWDTFPALPGTATDGVTETIEDRVAPLRRRRCRGQPRPGIDPPLDPGRGTGRQGRRRILRFRAAARGDRLYRFRDGSSRDGPSADPPPHRGRRHPAAARVPAALTAWRNVVRASSSRSPEGRSRPPSPLSTASSWRPGAGLAQRVGRSWTPPSRMPLSSIRWRRTSWPSRGYASTTGPSSATPSR